MVSRFPEGTNYSNIFSFHRCRIDRLMWDLFFGGETPPAEGGYLARFSRLLLCRASRLAKKKGRISDDFGLRNPVIQKSFSPKKGIPLS